MGVTKEVNVALEELLKEIAAENRRLNNVILVLMEHIEGLREDLARANSNLDNTRVELEDLKAGREG